MDGGTRVVLVGILIVLWAVGCGGGGDGEASALTRAEFSKQAERLCKRASVAKVVSLKRALEQGPGRKLNEAEQERLVLTAALPPVRAMAEKMAALEVTDDVASEARAIADEFALAVTRIQQDPRSALAAGFNNNVFNRAGRLSREFGLKACAQI